MHILLFYSLVFYGWWHPPHLVLIIASIVANYFFGIRISTSRRTKTWLFVSILANICLIGWFKYAGFIAYNVESWFGLEFGLPAILLPIGISFFTFQQIAYVVDVSKGYQAETSFFRYALFVSFFPQLIAGPIVRYQNIREHLINIEKKPTILFLLKRRYQLIEGFSLFIIGLAKKVIVADNLARYVAPVYDKPAGAEFELIEVWVATLAYSFQIYFDFSGYSDMAIGLARMFGFRLPVNFLSPYKASNPAEFWRRWHITLSNFLAIYVYLPLRGERRGSLSRASSVLVTMLIGGLWHGANWNFVVWGGIHGVLISMAHIFQRLNIKPPQSLSKIFKLSGCFLTFMLVTQTWVFFRAEDIRSAVLITYAMYDFQNIALPLFVKSVLPQLGHNATLSFGGIDPWHFLTGVFWITIAASIAFLTPNSIELFPHAHQKVHLRADDKQALNNLWQTKWKINAGWAVYVGFLFGLTVLHISEPSVFLYFQF